MTIGIFDDLTIEQYAAEAEVKIRDFDIEAAVIGCMLIDSSGDGNRDIITEALAELKAEMFAPGLCRTLFEKMAELTHDGIKFDPLILANEFGNKNIRAPIFRLTEFVPSISSYREYFRSFKVSALNRRMREAGAEYIDMGLELKPIAELQNRAVETLEMFADVNAVKAIALNKDATNILERLATPKEYLKTGIQTIDEVLRISEDSYVVIGARPSVGKTAFALQIAFEMARTKKVVFCSFETSAEKLEERLLANIAAVNFAKINTRTLSKLDWQSLGKAVAEIHNTNLVLIEAAGMTVQDIQTQAIRFNADVVFVDYLGLVAPPSSDKQMTAYEEVTKNSKLLHTMAQKRKITVIALCQMNREGKRELDMVNLRDSGQVEQDADAVLLIDREVIDDEDTGRRRIKIAKNKDGELKTLKFYFEGRYQKFFPVEEERS